MPELAPMERLVADGLVRVEQGRARTTPRWQAAAARAALRLQGEGAPWRDLRLPVAVAMVERYPDLLDDEIAGLVEAMLPVEEAELAPVLSAWEPASP